MPAPERKPRILLIGWDAADWLVLQPLVDRGLMPTLAGLMERGVWGNLATLQPMISPMLWTSIATGFTADVHGVLGFVEPGPDGRGIRPWSSTSRRVKAVWNILHQNGWRCHQIGWWASDPPEPLRGIVIPDTFRDCRPEQPGAMHPPGKAAHYAALQVRPLELDASHLLPFVPRAAEIDQASDGRLAQLARLLCDAASIQAMATEALENEPWDFAAVYFDSLDHFFHGFMPWHPPQLPHVSDRDYERYHAVVEGACRFHDMMLQRLLEIAGPETNVVICSDHGFLSGDARPVAIPNDPAGPTLWHRDMGLLVMAGPDIKAAGRICGTSLLDIAPIILHLAGLPAGQDMPGAAPEAALTGTPLPRIPSWEGVPGDCALPRPVSAAPPPARPGSSALVEQLTALGYLDHPAEDATAAAEAARREADGHLAQVYLSTGRPADALPLLERLTRECPWESRWVHQWAHACRQAGYHAQCLAILRAAWPEGSAAEIPPAVQLLIVQALLGSGDETGARWHLQRALAGLPRLPAVYVELGRAALELSDVTAAERAFLRALELDSTCTGAWEGLSTVRLRQRDAAAALETANRALALIRMLPQAQLNAGIALARLGRMEEARGAFRKVMEWRPGDAAPWRLCAALPDHSPQADFLRSSMKAEAQRLTRARLQAVASMKERAGHLTTLPAIPPPAERQRQRDLLRPPHRAAPSLSGKVLTLVSGLPRSGTSLMMQMLAAGGLPPQTDNLRPPDEDNPCGYFEWEAIKRLPSNPDILDAPGLEARAVKCISALLPHLPARHRYRILYMTRPPEEIAASQKAMRQRLHPGDEATLSAGALAAHSLEIQQMLAARPHFFEVLAVDFPGLLAAPELWCERIASFLGPERLPHPERMAAVIHPARYRSRGACDTPPR